MPASAANPRVTLVAFYRFPGFGRAYLAFSTMGIMKLLRMRHRGMQLGKMLGNGSGIGFGRTPDFHQYSVIGIFDTFAQATDYHRNSRFHRWLRRISTEEKILFLEAYQSRGMWDGSDPYPATGEKRGDALVILTRARLRFSRIRAFWKMVPAANESLAACEGCLFSAGMGEWPFSHPITFSLWQNEAAMIRFAYEGDAHRAAVDAARSESWFREALFVRYSILHTEGFGVNEL